MEKGVRSERALKPAVAEMYVLGDSPRKLAAIAEQLCGLEVASSTVSRAAAALDEELEALRSSPLGETPCLILDAYYDHARHGGQVRSCAVLVAIWIDTSGLRAIFGAPHAQSLHGSELVVGDAQGGLGARPRRPADRRAVAAAVPHDRERHDLRA